MTAVNITSMTGFARAEGRLEAKTPLAWAWEARSVNGKNLEVRARVPHGYESLEIPARQAVSELFARGSINLQLTTTSDTTAREVSIDEAVLDQLIALASRKALAFSREEKATIDPARLD